MEKATVHLLMEEEDASHPISLVATDSCSSYWGSLPDEVVLLVLSFLDNGALMASSMVCKRWRTLSLDPSLLRTVCK